MIGGVKTHIQGARSEWLPANPITIVPPPATEHQSTRGTMCVLYIYSYVEWCDAIHVKRIAGVPQADERIWIWWASNVAPRRRVRVRRAAKRADVDQDYDDDRSGRLYLRECTTVADRLGIDCARAPHSRTIRIRSLCDPRAPERDVR